MQGPPICSFFVPVVAAGAHQDLCMPRCRADPGRTGPLGGSRQDRRIVGAGGSWSEESHGGGDARLGKGIHLYFLSTLAFLVLGILFIFGSNRFQGGQSAPREGQDDGLAAKVLGEEEAQELHRRARRRRALRQRALEWRRRRNQ